MTHLKTFLIILIINFLKINAFNHTFSYIGCYNDLIEQRDVYEIDYSEEIKNSNRLDIVEFCVSLCGKDGYRVAALQTYDECYCGNLFGRYDKTDDTECFFRCGNNSCGGHNKNSIYLINSETNQFGSYRALAYQQPNPCQTNPCKNFGTCVNIFDGNGNLKNFICKCNHVGYLGPLCEQKDHCFSNPCLNGGDCLNLFDRYKCNCPSVWTGHNCEKLLFPSEKLLNRGQTCSPSEILQCANGGTCIKNLNGSFNCSCPKNYSGLYCEVLDICSLKPCKNNGHCMFNPPSNFKCECGLKYTGALCEQDNPCASLPCSNGGICIPQQNPYLNNITFTCECLSGFYGSNCEFSTQISSICNPNPCKYGSCQLFSGGYHCECYNGWTGPNCDLPCQFDSDCMNNGTCIRTAEMNYCQCEMPFTGEKCEIEIKNSCLPNPCKENERCLVSAENSTFICESLEDFSNTNWCLIKENMCNESSKCLFYDETKTYYCECIDNNSKNCNYSLTTEDLRRLVSPMRPKSENDALENRGIELFGLNLESLYWIIPLCMVVIILGVFLGVGGYMGYKSRRNKSIEGKDCQLHTSVVNMHFLTQPSLSHDYSMKHASTISVPNVSFPSPLSYNPSQTDSFDKV